MLDERDAATFGASAGTAPNDARAGRLSAIVGALRERPDALAGKQVRIPFHTDPIGMAFVRQRAQVVMCGSHAACQVEFAPTIFDPATLTLADRTDAAMAD